MRVFPATKNAHLSNQMDQLPRVLLVETNVKQQVAIEKILKKEAFQWDLANHGEQAVSYFTRLPRSSASTGKGVATGYGVVLLTDTVGFCSSLHSPSLWYSHQYPPHACSWTTLTSDRLIALCGRRRNPNLQRVSCALSYPLRSSTSNSRVACALIAVAPMDAASAPSLQQRRVVRHLHVRTVESFPRSR